MGVYGIVHSFQDYVNSGNGWLFLPAAIVLGALHGLEPGHSKTMMAAFIVSIRGTVKQALLLALSATFSHTCVIWILALVGLHYSAQFSIETLEPYFQVGIGLIIVAMALWMVWRVRKLSGEGGHSHGHPHEHGEHGGLLVKTEEGFIEISIFEAGVPPEFRLFFYNPQRQPVSSPRGDGLELKTVRPNGETEAFGLAFNGDFLKSTKAIAEPHEFEVVLQEKHGSHVHSYSAQFSEDDHHHHPDPALEAVDPEEYEDAHERAHAMQIQQHFANRPATTGQIVLFGLTGGLIPCPTAFAVLLVCLQLKQFALGFATVLAFSVGLAITMMTVGAVAAYSVGHVSKRFKNFGKMTRYAPYASATFMTVIGLFILFEGAKHLGR